MWWVGFYIGVVGHAARVREEAWVKVQPERVPYGGPRIGTMPSPAVGEQSGGVGREVCGTGVKWKALYSNHRKWQCKTSKSNPKRKDVEKII